MEIKNIKTPQDILTFMTENIEYGWLDYKKEKHIKTMKNFRKEYRTQSLQETLKYKIGCCIDQVYLMHFLLDEEHMHCFILYYKNNKVYQIEHPNFEKIGIYEFNSEKEAIDTIVTYYINLSGGKDRPTTEFFDVPIGLSFKEFNNYINSLDN